MIKKLLPLVLILSGLGAGVGAGIALKKPSDEHADAAASPCGDPLAAGMDPTPVAAPPPEDSVATTFLKLPEQFVVPVVDGDRVKSLVVMSITLEISEFQEEQIFSRLPKLRDGFLRVMLDHANIGGFDGAFTSNGSMDALRRGFREVAAAEFAEGIHEILILDINRQDLG
ncbi:flagellar basal body-associated FliL family protein [Maribius pontilimi]|uniref:Flagellar basal body-associated FliL family protein n=1 Tax=Palleronia pontilimi TaxID=1964209 RepID=A0A934IHI2_9RHOB|nr:flagellar basal body-associated FliL family protein [Palleronia pontilimi]MBJ3763182.1 flagellar basal body-associated FliL family protein [Palleronia pontilimi]